jgi:hypothetical protein
MAFKAGKGAHVLIDGVAGSLVDVTAYADSMSFPQPVDTIETTTFGDTAKDFIPGLTDGGQFQISGPLDVALGTFVSGVKAAQAAGSSTSTVNFSPGGSVAGQIKVSCETYISAYDISVGVGGRVEYSSTWQVTGAVTNGTW